LPCSVLQGAGIAGFILEKECAVLADIFEDDNVCGCTDCVTIPKDTDVCTADLTVEGCSICGKGERISNRDDTFVFVGYPEATCGVLEDLGMIGELEPFECSALNSLIRQHGCECEACEEESTDMPSTSAPSDTKAPAPTPATSILDKSICPRTLESGCSVCGEGRKVGNGSEIFEFPSYDPVECFELEVTGLVGGSISQAQCEILPSVTTFTETCGCVDCETIPVPEDVCSTDFEVEGCSICGEGFRVGNRGAIFSFSSFPRVQCGLLEDIGLVGELSEFECGVLPDLIGACECEPCDDVGGVGDLDDVTDKPSTASPTEAPTYGPTTPAPIPMTPVSTPGRVICPQLPNDTACSVCGPGRAITNDDTIFAYPGEPALPCSVLQGAGIAGFILEKECAVLADIFEDDNVCGCTDCVTIPKDTDVCTADLTVEGCSICGKGERISNRDDTFVFVGYPEATCGVLEDLGMIGELEPFECSALNSLIRQHGCECEACEEESTDMPSTSAPSDTKAPAPTPATSILDKSICPRTLESGCSVCGEGRKVGNGSEIFEFPSYDPVECFELEVTGLVGGSISQAQCEILPSVTTFTETCGCVDCETIPVPEDVCSTDFEVEGCSICGEGFRVGNRGAIFSFSSFPRVQCGLLEDIGLVGELSEFECGVLPDLIGACECEPCDDDPPTTPIVAPVTPSPISPAPVTPAPVTPSPISSAPVTPAPVTPAPVITTSAPTECTVCDNRETQYMKDNGYDCAGTNSAGIIKRFCNKNAWWRANKWCQQRCFDETYGYEGDNCCEPAPSDSPSITPSNVPSFDPTELPSNIPSVAPSNAPVTPSPTLRECPVPQSMNSCSICGEGKTVGIDYRFKIFSNPGQPDSSCGWQELLALFRNNDEDNCELSSEDKIYCGCEDCLVVPTPMPVPFPSSSPSSTPTSTPSFSFQPTKNPTELPSLVPTNMPSVELSEIPTLLPSSTPTSIPSFEPTMEPTDSPSSSPSVSPSFFPTSTPSSLPTATPTLSPSFFPTLSPSSLPTATPTISPSSTPTLSPSSLPTAIPTISPSSTPTLSPSSEPTASPTSSPSSTPTLSPSSEPTASPTNAPSSEPSFLPTAFPSAIPSIQGPTPMPTLSLATIGTYESYLGKKGKRKGEKRQQKEKNTGGLDE